jgi:hypothetical protein
MLLKSKNNPDAPASDQIERPKKLKNNYENKLRERSQCLRERERQRRAFCKGVRSYNCVGTLNKGHREIAA